MAELELLDRSLVDARGSALTRVQITPAIVDLVAGLGEVSVSLGANDDQAGLTAEVEIFDGAARPLASELVECVTPQLDCSVTLQLLQLDLASDSAEGNVVVILRDGAGREVR